MSNSTSAPWTGLPPGLNGDSNGEEYRLTVGVFVCMGVPCPFGCWYRCLLVSEAMISRCCSDHSVVHYRRPTSAVATLASLPACPPPTQIWWSQANGSWCCTVSLDASLDEYFWPAGCNTVLVMGGERRLPLCAQCCCAVYCSIHFIDLNVILVDQYLHSITLLLSNRCRYPHQLLFRFCWQLVAHQVCLKNSW